MGNARSLSLLLGCIFVCTAVSRAAGQSSPPNIDDYIASKFDLGIGNAATITTVEGNSTATIEQVLDIQASQFSPGVSAKNKGFVTANGTQFHLNGEPWYCAGTNAYYAALKYIMSDTEVAVMMKEHAQRGVNVLRVFTHSNFDSVPNAIMPKFGVYNEHALRRVDLTLAAAAENGIRIIMVMSNYWPFLGSMQEWVDMTLGPGKPVALFYTDPQIKKYYKDWLKTLITRKNTVTGQKYIDDPTIMAWELANEPRVGGPRYEQKLGLPPGMIVCDWVYEMSSYVKSLDQNHMIAVGDEGFRVNGSTAEPHSWINTGYDGVDFLCNMKAPNVSFGTVHAYPDAWGMSNTTYDWLDENFLEDRAEIAKKLNKPIILEEYGVRRGYIKSRDEVFGFLHDTANSYDYACTLVWAASHYSSTTETLYGYNDGQGYVFGYPGSGSFDTNGSESVLDQYHYMKKKREAAGSAGIKAIPEVEATAVVKEVDGVSFSLEDISP